MDRRTFLATSTFGLAGLAGCLGSTGSTPESTATPASTETPAQTETRAPAKTTESSTTESAGTTEAVQGPSNDDDLPADDEPMDGYPPAFDQVPEERAIDTDAYERMESGVVLAPIEDVYYWYARGEARIVDARSKHAFDRSHILGAVSSPVNQGSNGDDPVADFPKEDRVIAYCACPHHLSSMRAEEMMNDGHENVFVIDEGFREWDTSNYPMAGEEVARFPVGMTLRGKTDPASAGQTAWARHQPTGQMEATPVSADGSYEMTLHFYDVSANSRVEVETPDYRVEGSISELTSGVITGSN